MHVWYEICGVERALNLYAAAVIRNCSANTAEDEVLPTLNRALACQWEQWSDLAQAVGKAIAT